MRVLAAEQVFDGQRMLANHAVVIEGDTIAAVVPVADAPGQPQLWEGTLAPAFLDLQVNGGGGHLIGADTDRHALAHVCATHQSLGCAGVLPTLISDRPEVTRRVLQAGIAVAQAGVPGFLGLHLEGPHLDPIRKGAHDGALLRTMTGADLTELLEAARHLPTLMVTLAPEAVTSDQITALAQAGVIVSLGHSDCSFEVAQAAIAAGARCVTHLFNAMSQMASRAPGLVGAVLAGGVQAGGVQAGGVQAGGVQAGLIADLVHAHPAALRVALSARAEGLFLVSDCMSLAGTAQTEFALHGRRILRSEGRLTLEDGTLAGADLTLDQAVANLIGLGTPPERALRMASAEPARLLGLSHRYGALAPGRAAEIVWLGRDWRLRDQG